MARYDDQRSNVFLILWTLAVAATTICFLVYLSVRAQSFELGYELGRSQAEMSRLREVERVLALELSAQETPERVDLIGRSLFGMEEPEASRIFSAGEEPRGSVEPRALEAQSVEGRRP